MAARLWAVAAVCAAVGLPCAAAPALPEGPLTLEECLSLARLRNPSVVIARQDVRSAEAGLRGAVSAYYPSASLNATQGRTGGTSFVETAAGTIPFGTATTRRESDVTLRYTVWQTGRADMVGRARQALEASRAQEETTLEELMVSVARLYYGALAAQDLVGVAEARLEAARQHEELVRARAAVGEAPPVDVAPAEAETAAAEFELLQARNEAALARARLKREIGLPPTYDLRLAEAGHPVPTPEPTLEEALETAYGRRPELAQVRAGIAAAQAGLRVTEATGRGVVTVAAEYVRGLSGPREGEAWAATVAGTAFLFDGGGRRAETEGARARVDLLRAQEEQVWAAVGLEVESALLRVRTARESVVASGKAVESAQARVRAARGKYEAGVGIFVEILDAEQALTRARTNRIAALYEQEMARVELLRAMGLLAEADW